MTETKRSGDALRIIGVEEHFAPPGSRLPRLHANADFAEMQQTRIGDIEHLRLPEMDATGVSMQVLSCGTELVYEDAKSPAARATAYNNAVGDLVARYPDRFAAFADIAWEEPQQAADELQRAVAELGLKGVLVNGHVHGEYLDSEKFRVVWERAQALDVPVYLHPASPLETPSCLQGYPELTSWGWAFETGSHALRLIASGLFDQFPNLKVILGHMGEGIPFFLSRIVDRWSISPSVKRLERNPADYFRRNFYVSTSGVLSNEALQCTIDVLGADRILFAADYPHQALPEHVDFIRKAPISEAHRHKIAYENATRLLKL